MLKILFPGIRPLDFTRALLILAATFCSAQTATILHTFQGRPDGSTPKAQLVADSDGNLYGTTAAGGSSGYGTVYELPAGGGEKALYSFTGAADGAYPGGSLLRDSAGNLYGTTWSGGRAKGNCAFLNGCGVVFKLNPEGQETVLYSFAGGTDGAAPVAGLIGDVKGTLYGTTYYGGKLTGACASYGCGVIFKLDSAGTETILHRFRGLPDGQSPLGSLVRDAAGNLYGTTAYGGVRCSLGLAGCGVVYKVDSKAHETVLYSFSGGADGGFPYLGSLIFDPQGNLYGTTSNGGASAYGTVFKLDSAGKQAVLYSFTGAVDGGAPFAGVIRDPQGNLYGTAIRGGTFGGSCGTAGCGTVFKITPAGTETVLYSFDDASGSQPISELLFYNDLLYGTASSGGTLNQGVTFKLQP